LASPVSLIFSRLSSTSTAFPASSLSTKQPHQETPNILSHITFFAYSFAASCPNILLRIAWPTLRRHHHPASPLSLLSPSPPGTVAF
jgi:hypothetical protein